MKKKWFYIFYDYFIIEVNMVKVGKFERGLWDYDFIYIYI